MNKKIRELAEQSGFFPVPDETEWDWDYRAENARYERFAELIVKECANRVDHILREKSLGGGTYSDDIKEYFGVGK